MSHAFRHLKATRVTPAQFRMLGRGIRGDRLPVARYHHATVNALARKKCFVVRGAHWEATPLGRKVYASRGIYRPSLANHSSKENHAS